MKKSEAFRQLQVLVINTGAPLTDDTKLELLRVLMDHEDIERMLEELKAKEGADADGTA